MKEYRNDISLWGYRVRAYEDFLCGFTDSWAGKVMGKSMDEETKLTFRSLQNANTSEGGDLCVICERKTGVQGGEEESRWRGEQGFGGASGECRDYCD